MDTRETIEAFRTLMGHIYSDMYYHPGKWDEGKLARQFDELIADGQPPILIEINRITQDCISSDREAAAFMVARQRTLQLLG